MAIRGQDQHQRGGGNEYITTLSFAEIYKDGLPPSQFGAWKKRLEESAVNQQIRAQRCTELAIVILTCLALTCVCICILKIPTKQLIKW